LKEKEKFQNTLKRKSSNKRKRRLFCQRVTPPTQTDLQLRLPLYRNYLLEDTLLRRKDLFFPPDWAVRFTIIWSKITERALQRDKIC